MRSLPESGPPVDSGDRVIFVRLLGICSVLVAACAAHSPPIPKAVFVIVDGIPADTIESVATPNLDEIRDAGGYARAFVGGILGDASESPTVSAVGYHSLLTGTWANKHNVVDNDVSDPDYRYWDIFRVVKSHDPALRTALFSTWTDNRTKLLGHGLEAAGGHKLDYHFDGLELDTERFPEDEHGENIRQIDALVAAEAARYVGEQGPDLSWVYLQYTDDAAHRHGDGPEFAEAVRIMDRHVGLIWDSIRERRRHRNEDWLVIVTTDHGRDAETGREHGEQSERERTIWIATNSGRLNERFYALPGIVDIMPSIAAHLGLDIPPAIAANLDGRSFID